MGKTSLDIREALIHDYHQKRSSGPAHSHNNFNIQSTGHHRRQRPFTSLSGASLLEFILDQVGKTLAPI